MLPSITKTDNLFLG